MGVFYLYSSVDIKHYQFRFCDRTLRVWICRKVNDSDLTRYSNWSFPVATNQKFCIKVSMDGFLLVEEFCFRKFDSFCSLLRSFDSPKMQKELLLVLIYSEIPTISMLHNHWFDFLVQDLNLKLSASGAPLVCKKIDVIPCRWNWIIEQSKTFLVLKNFYIETQISPSLPDWFLPPRSL